MARVTIEDCLENVENRFKLVLMAAKRARQIDSGVAPMVAPENDKATVIALREIADGLIGQEVLETVTASQHASVSQLTDAEVLDNISE